MIRCTTVLSRQANCKDSTKISLRSLLDALRKERRVRSQVDAAKNLQRSPSFNQRDGQAGIRLSVYKRLNFMGDGKRKKEGSTVLEEPSRIKLAQFGLRCPFASVMAA